MSSRATQQLIDERRRRAEVAYPETLNRLTQDFVDSMRKYDPDFDPDEAALEKLRKRFDGLIEAASGSD